MQMTPLLKVSELLELNKELTATVYNGGDKIIVKSTIVPDSLSKPSGISFKKISENHIIIMYNDKEIATYNVVN